MSEDALDQWAEWLVRTRFAESTEEEKAAALERLAAVREHVLDGARIEPADFVLDVGAGTGLLTAGALDRVGPDGDVMALDVSVDCLEELERSVRDGRLWLLIGDADVLPLPGELVDAVLTRSVLIYVEERAEAAREFFRVLRPGGRVSLFEPLNRRNAPLAELVELAELAPLADARHQGRLAADDPMLDFDAADLEGIFSAAGFAEVRGEV
ncbi:MAG: arsenite methyltransferase, partial [Gaiellaceae bacterium]|nr:arsenite methyltransferase [Gaiellaceae bacterium]